MAVISGSTGNDILNGTPDDDILTGGQGNDTINGAAGTNTAVYSGPASRYTVTPDGTGGFYVQDSLGASGDGTDHLTNIQWLQFSDQTVAPDSVAMGATLNATSSVTTVIGSGGNDTLNAGPGTDTLIGGGGNDTYTVNGSADQVIELARGGFDVVNVSAASWTATAGSEIEKVFAAGTANVNLTGNGLAIELDGNSGINTLDDAGGAAVLVGGQGNDTYVVRNAATVVTEKSGEGTDTVKTTLASYTLGANLENLTFIGTGNFYGAGNGLANIITGGAGNDTLVGGGGAARLVGGAGNDSYIVDNAIQTVVEAVGGGYDTEFTSLASLKAAANVEALTYTGSGAFSGFANDTGTVMTGGSGNDTLTSGAGADIFDGAGGNNTVVFQSTRANYTVYADSSSGYWVRDNTTSVFDRLINIQSIRFSDKTVAPGTVVSGIVFKGTAGADDMTGGTGSDLFYAGGGDNINGVSGTDTVVYSGTRAQYVFYGDGAGGYYAQTAAAGLDPSQLDRLVNITSVQFSDQTVQPAAQTVGLFLKGGAGADVLTGGAGNDVFVATGGDVIDGGSGTNTAVYSGVSTSYSVYSDGVGGYYVRGAGAGNSLALFDHLTSVQTLQFADRAASISTLVVGQLIQGNGSAQPLVGGTGSDLIFGGAGDNDIDGGGGTNTAVYAGPASRYTVYSDGGAGWFVQDNLGNEGNDHLVNISYLQFSDGVTTPAALAPPFNGQSVVGTAGADTLTGTALNDYIAGYGGGDTIDGGGGLDTVRYSGDRSAYTVRGDGAGGYYVQTNANGNSIGLFDHLKGISLIEFHDGVASTASQSVGVLLTGTAGADTLTGGLGADLFVGKGGGDTIDGSGGVNVAIYQGCAAQYTVYGDGSGGYYVRTNAAGPSVSLFDHLLNIQYLRFDDATTAPSPTGVLLFGTSGADTLSGGAGNDLIVGRGGGDQIDGGGGFNTAVYAGTMSRYLVLGDGMGAYFVRDNGVAANSLVFDKLSSLQNLQFDDQTVSVAWASHGLLIQGTAVADNLFGGAGDDLIVGGAGDDRIDGGAGFDTAAYSGLRANYEVYQDGCGGSYVAAIGAGTEGLDHLSHISALQFSDQTVAPAAASIGGAWVGSAAAETITGGSGSDLLIGGEGGDLLDGSAGVDTAVYAGSLSQYQVTPDGSGGFYVKNFANASAPDHLLNIEHLRFGIQTVAPDAVASGAVLTAPAAGGAVLGSGGNDTLIGLDGDDTLTGGGGQDTINGGAGTNTAVYSGAASRYTVTPDGFGGFYVADSLGAAGDGTDRISNVQYLKFADQTVTPAQVAVGAVLTGLSGQTSLIGSSGADTLVAGPDAQALSGGGGNDTYYVNLSDDTVVESAGGGFDTVNVSASSWTATTGSAIERIVAATGTSAINLTGNALSMEIDGNAGANVLDDGGGAGMLIGLGGNDTYVVRNAGTTVVEAAGGGNDTIKTTLNFYALAANFENLTFIGSDPYYGIGNSGNNVLTGGLGAGTLDGGGGNDTFVVFNTNTTLIANGGGNQTVVANTNFVLPNGFNTLKLFGTGPSGKALTGVGNDAGDVFIGDSNKQVFVGGAGNDTFTGGGGSDMFSIAGPQSGNDVITDFITGTGGSVVRLSADGFTSFAQIQGSLAQVGADTVLTLSPTDSITFKNTQVSSFTASNFVLPLDTSNLSLTFNDDFNSLSLSNGVSGIWSTTFGFVGATPLSSRTLQATGEQQIYVDSGYAGTGATALGLDPFSINNGVLSITAQATPTDLQSQLYGIGYTSGLLTTQSSFAQTYGYFEMRAQLPTASGAWPAFWLLPAAGTNPPELDILEASGMTPSSILTTAHDIGVPGAVAATTSFIPGAGTGMHTYGLLWKPDYITWYIDGAQVFQIATPADMNQPMYMLLNLAVGGSVGGTPDAQGLASSPFQIDYVRAYALNGITVADNSASQVVSDGKSIPATSAGNDTIVGGAGFADAFGKNSELNGRNGVDTVTYVGLSSQYAVYGDGHGGYFVADKSMALMAGGVDHLTNIEAIQFSDRTVDPASIASGVYLQGSPAADVLSGTSANDVIFGYSGADTINAGDGDDIIMGGNGTDQIDGGAGTNTAVYFGLHNQYAVFKSFPFDGSYNIVDRYGFEGNDHLVNTQFLQFQDGLLSIDVAAASVVYTDAGSDNVLQFGIGWDVVTGGANDTMDGGDGMDIAVYSGPQSRYTVYSDGGAGYWVEDSVADGTGIGRQHLLNFEKLQFSDVTVNLGSGLATSALIVGGAGADVLTATWNSDFFIGGGGNDTIDGAASTSSVVRYSGPIAQYQIFQDGAGGYYVVDPTFGLAGAGVDHLIGNITGLSFSDQTTAPGSVTTGTAIVGTSGAETLTGGAGNDLILGGGGGDSIDGGGGVDT
ncbi:MAG: glycosyl hydrolase family protein, partial [Bradyrhizobiaceae bacterium]